MPLMHFFIFGRAGSGLNEQLTSLSGNGRIDRRTQQRIRSIASMRNKLVHSVDANKLTVSNTFGESARRQEDKLVFVVFPFFLASNT